MERGMTSSSGKPADEDPQWPHDPLEDQLDTGIIDEMDECYEFGPDPWLAERIRQDLEGDAVSLYRMPMLIEDLAGE